MCAYWPPHPLQPPKTSYVSFFSFVCQDAGFHTNCQVLHGSSGHCVNVPASLNDVISSFGPDSGQDCFIFESASLYASSSYTQVLTI
jgi:hypothetical protein